MRLRDTDREAICRLFIKHFGEQAHLWLFGSRTDDTRRGGDIDLYIETAETDLDQLIRLKHAYAGDLLRTIGDRHVDIVINSGTDHQVIYDLARATGIQLV